jgi:hypothetical protein
MDQHYGHFASGCNEIVTQACYNKISSNALAQSRQPIDFNGSEQRRAPPSGDLVSNFG